MGGYATSDDYGAFFKNGEGVHTNVDRSKPERLVGQLVFMVIDALRADFVFSSEHINQVGLKFKKTDDSMEQGRNLEKNLIQ